MAEHAPKGLGPKGKETWKQITKDYQLRTDEKDILEDICREADMIDRLEDAMVGADLLVQGSQGQQVANPLIGELRQHRATKKALWAQLKLPDTNVTELAGNQQRDAAQSRWAAAHGAGA